MKKGFTLIELLAVIVILAIIALIAVPIVLNIIGDTKEESNKKSIDMYGKAVENAISNYKLDNPTEKNIKPYMLYKSWNNKKDYIEYDGSKVECDIQINSGKVYLSNCKVDGNLVEDYTYGEESMNAHIGEVVNYVSGTGWEGTGLEPSSNPNYNRWVILGEENGQIKLISNHVVGVTPSEKTTLTFSNKVDYETGVERLNSICAQYGNGEGADYARSIRVDDINQVLGYNPSKTADTLTYNNGKINEYGNTVTYTMRDGVLTYTSANGVKDPDEKLTTVYYKLDGTQLAEGESITVKSDWYYYDPTTLYEPQTGSYSYGIKIDSAAYNVLFTNWNSIVFWLADQSVSTKGNYTSYGIRFINTNGSGLKTINRATLYKTDGTSVQSHTGHIRAVVYLDVNAKLVKQDDGTWNIEI